MSETKLHPLYIDDKDRHFMNVAKAVGEASTHPIAKGGCILVRDNEIIGDGRSILAECKVEIDCVTYAIATACKRGTPSAGAYLYTTRYPFSASIFQLYLMGVRKVIVLAHDWEPYYKDEFRRAARLARELFISIEPLFDDEDEHFSTNNQAPRFDNREEQFNNKDLYTHSPATEHDSVLENYELITNDNPPV